MGDNKKNISKSNKNTKNKTVYELKKELADFTPDEVINDNKDFVNKFMLNKIEGEHKLLCNYETFSKERNKCDMFVPDACEICYQKFDKNDEVHCAWDKDLKEIFICSKLIAGIFITPYIYSCYAISK